MSVRVGAPAKVNLTLRVGAPRADGLHPLQSVAAFAPLGEWVEAEKAERLSLTIIGPFAADIEADENNLVLRAARALADAAGVSAPGAALTLYKDMPIASGIGGGSSDAAATLKALNVVWGLGYDGARLAEIARALGADAPVCVHARAAYMTGTGEDFAPFALPPLYGVLINPRRPLATPAVYRQFDAMGLGADFDAAAPAPIWPDLQAAIAGMRVLGNDLAAPAAALAPELAHIAQMLRTDFRALYANMSGSGATMFALCETMELSRALAHAFAAAHPQHWVRAAALS
ncbi:MAG TPA: 4-(cytidine 5'-diphospho)-2-C-methyl-D-erythritol kinase [Terricaulis sp.]|nr:4-(cytidine 5'-diphospho)-2-C-methyl-D-erythritol kinase [Terricaulis sp.]